VRSPAQTHGNLLVGIFSLLVVFLLAVWVTVWLLTLSGWNPLEDAVQAYSGMALAFTGGTTAVVAIFQWARKP